MVCILSDHRPEVLLRYVANNYNNIIAGNAKLTIVEVREEMVACLCFAQAEEIVSIGTLSPNAIHCPGIFIDRVVKSTEPKQPEILTTAPPPSTSSTKDPKVDQSTRAAQEIGDGVYVNISVGIPTLVTEHLHSSIKTWLQCENGTLGMGPFPSEDNADPSVPIIPE